MQTGQFQSIELLANDDPVAGQLGNGHRVGLRAGAWRVSGQAVIVASVVRNLPPHHFLEAEAAAIVQNGAPADPFQFIFTDDLAFPDRAGSAWILGIMKLQWMLIVWVFDDEGCQLSVRCAAAVVDLVDIQIEVLSLPVFKAL